MAPPGGPAAALGETIHRRFLGAKPRFSARELRYLTEVDGVDHIALVAGENEAVMQLLAHVTEHFEAGRISRGVREVVAELQPVAA